MYMNTNRRQTTVRFGYVCATYEATKRLIPEEKEDGQTGGLWSQTLLMAPGFID